MRRFRVYLIFGLLLAASLGISAARPHAYQKLNTLRPADGFKPVRMSSAPVDIARIIEDTPYTSETAGTVNPYAKYQQTIEEGAGNCSERAFGMAWKLRESEVDYQIVHLMRSESFAIGGGHTVLRVGYDDDGVARMGVVDLLEGGIPTNGGEPLDIADLTQGPIPDFELRRMTPLLDDESDWYGEFLDGAAIGYIEAHEVNRYFAFIERIYVPLGNEKIEKLVFDGIALLFGVLPNIYVPDYESLVEAHRVEALVQKLSFWIQRASLVILPLFALFEIGRRVDWRRLIGSS